MRAYVVHIYVNALVCLSVHAYTRPLNRTRACMYVYYNACACILIYVRATTCVGTCVRANDEPQNALSVGHCVIG